MSLAQRAASGSRSRAACSQTAGPEVWRLGSDDRDQDPLPEPTKTLIQDQLGYIAPVSSDLAVSVSTGPDNRKRKCRSSSEEIPDDGRPSTSVKRPAKRPRKGQDNRKRKRRSSSQEIPDDGRPSTSVKRPAKRLCKEVYVQGPLLGQGGFGSVFAGIRRSDGLPVAIKYVSKDKSREMLKVEGQDLLPLEVALMTRVNSAPACPNILQLVEWFECHTHYCMILERPFPCQDLQSFCEENGCLDERLAKKVLEQLIAALKHCESRGVLHRDVKPENLLISTPSHDIKLLDFGCGDLLKDSAYTSFAGTLEFAPPEWFDQRCYHAGPATVWSVGVTLYNILCFPFRAARRISFQGRLLFPRGLSKGKS